MSTKNRTNQAKKQIPINVPAPGLSKNKKCREANQSGHQKGMREFVCKKENTSTSSSPSIVVDDSSPVWLSMHNSISDDPESKVTLYRETKTRMLHNGTWLSDTEVHAGQILLKRDFPLIDGLHDPVIQGSLVTPATSEFVQVVNTGSHWVCVSTIGCDAGTIKVFDSMFRMPKSIVIDHACRMLHHSSDTVTFINEKVQKQVGGDDCGLFALVFATELCHGLDPTNQRYNQGVMRQHYVSCLESGSMVPFPKTTKRVPYHLDSKKTSVPIYCICRLPNNKKEYIQCFQCHDWYHSKCADIPDWAVKTMQKWRCQKRKDASKLTRGCLAEIIKGKK